MANEMHHEDDQTGPDGLPLEPPLDVRTYGPELCYALHLSNDDVFVSALVATHLSPNDSALPADAKRLIVRSSRTRSF